MVTQEYISTIRNHDSERNASNWPAAMGFEPKIPIYVTQAAQLLLPHLPVTRNVNLLPANTTQQPQN